MKSSINPSEAIKDIAERINRMKANELKIISKQDFIKFPEKSKRLELGELVQITKIEQVFILKTKQYHWVATLNNNVNVSLRHFEKYLGKDLFTSTFVVTETNVRKWFEDGTTKESYQYKFSILK